MIRFALPLALPFAVVGILLSAGCQTAKVSRTVVADLGADDQDTQIEFWHTLATKPVASNDDAFHALIPSKALGPLANITFLASGFHTDSIPPRVCVVWRIEPVENVSPQRMADRQVRMVEVVGCVMHHADVFHHSS